MSKDTLTAVSQSSRDEDLGVAWALTVALDCDRLFAPPLRLGLGRVDEVEIGRGGERCFRRAGGRLRLDLDDDLASQVHLRLRREVDRWTIEDAGSKNGTRVNGERVERAPVSDGDVIECGGTFLVLRRAPGEIRDLEAPADGSDAERTLSPSLERDLGVLPRIARSRVSVLVRGESGTGKELIASAVHTLSGRTGPFVAVNCGAIPGTLIESELFGTRRGAFSGAEDRPGLVRNADKGTLFLDEVAELPLAAQAALLRVLQEGEVLTLGSGKAIAVDVRVVAATNRALEELIADGGFRRDLHARLRGYELHLPPLRQRLEDLGLMVGSLLRRIEPQRPTRRLSRGAARALFLHAWPYHVRELQQVLQAGVAVAETDELRLEDLPLGASEPRSDTTHGERDKLVELLARHGGNLSAVARDLSTSRSQVLRLLTRYQLDLDSFRRH